MKHLLLRRAALLPLLLLGVALFGFLIVHLTPGDPARQLAGGSSATPKQVRQARSEYGLDKPLPVQFVTYIGNVVQGNLGTSLTYKRSVGSLLRKRAPATIELVFASLLIGVPVGLMLGIFAARRRDSLADHLTSIVSVAGISLPIFWLAYMVVWLVSVQLGWLPLGGRLPAFTELHSITGINPIDAALQGEWATLGESLRYLVLPALVLAIVPVALIARFARASYIEVLGQDYIQTARAYGIRERDITWRQATKNALLPLITLLGILVPAMLIAAVLSEAVFTWQGVGNLLLGAMQNRDYAVVESVVLLIGVVCVVANALVDVSYALLDPRIRYS